MSHTLSPKTKEPHIGVEIEFTLDTKQSKSEFLKVFTPEEMLKLNITGGTNYDTETPIRQWYEFRLLTTVSNYKEDIKQLCTKLVNAGVSINQPNGYGLHIHLDCRYTDWKNVFMSLFHQQDRLFSMCSAFRHTYGCCKKVWDITTQESEKARLKVNFDVGNGLDNHLKEVNGRKHSKSSSITHCPNYKTVEVRMHESTLDHQVINDWITDLLKTAGYLTEPVKQTSSEPVYAEA